MSNFPYLKLLSLSRYSSFISSSRNLPVPHAQCITPLCLIFIPRPHLFPHSSSPPACYSRYLLLMLRFLCLSSSFATSFTVSILTQVDIHASAGGSVLLSNIISPSSSGLSSDSPLELSYLSWFWKPVVILPDRQQVCTLAMEWPLKHIYCHRRLTNTISAKRFYSSCQHWLDFISLRKPTFILYVPSLNAVIATITV